MNLASLTQFGAASGVPEQTQTGIRPARLDRIAWTRKAKVMAQFTNGQTRALAQVVLSRFYQSGWSITSVTITSLETVESGVALASAPTINGLGRVLSGTVETIQR